MTLGERVGIRIRQVRTAAGMSQARLAELIGVEPETISRYERGFREPSLERIEAITLALDSGLKEFFQGLFTTQDSLKSEDIQSLNDLVSPLPAHQVRAILHLVHIHIRTVESAREEDE